MNPISSSRRKRESGQILIEYLLLTLISIGIAAIFVRVLVSRGESSGALFRRWDAVNKQIGADDPGKY